MAKETIIYVRVEGKQARAELDGLSRAFTRFGANVRHISSAASQAVSGVRQIAQGIQNLGFVTSFFIALPLSRALQDMAKSTLDFERAMVEVQKTTGLSSTAIKGLSDEIRELSTRTPTSALELANLAAEAGRAGVGLGSILAGDIKTATAEILEFTRVTDMMVIATTLGGEEGAQAFGRFITVFKDLDVSGIEKLGSAINELGQSASVNEQDIVGSMMRIAPAAAVLGMSAQDVAALATAITQTSESTARGGTRMRVALEGMVTNWQEAAKLIGETTDTITQRIGEDALSVFLELTYAIGQIEDPISRQKTAMEVFGTTGANAVNRLAAAFPDLIRFLDISNKAFNEGTSLQIEFNRAIGATKEQLKILKDTITEVGFSFAEDLLPIAKEVIGMLIAAFRELAIVVKGLTVQKKLLILAVAALVVVGLPLLALLGSIGFAFSMMLSGLVNVIGGLVSLAMTILTLGSGAAVLSTILTGLAVIVGSVLAVALAKATGTFDIIIKALQNVAAKAEGWGEGIVASLASGIISAATSVLITALEFVGGIVENFLGAFSPPKSGPLSEIDTWGRNLINTYLKAFKTADFGMLKELTSLMERVLGQIKLPEHLPGFKEGMLFEARASLAKLIAQFNKTGKISSEILGKLSGMMGEFGEDVTKLIRLQLQYNKALEALDRIRRKQTDVEDAYKSEIRQAQSRTDMSAAERMDMIRNARQKRNFAREGLSNQEKAAQKTADGLKDQVDWQKEYISAVLDTEDAIDNILKKLKKVASSLASAAKGLADKLGDLFKKLEINLKMQELYKQKGMDITGLLRKELSIRKNIVAELLKLKDPTEEQIKMIDENLNRIKELEGLLGKTAGAGIPTISGAAAGVEEAKAALEEQLNAAVESVKTFADILSEGTSSWEAFKSGIRGDALSPEDFMDLGPTAGKFHVYGLKINETWDKITSKFDEVKGKFEKFKDDFNKILGEFTGDKEMSKVGEGFGGIGAGAEGIDAGGALSGLTDQFSSMGLLIVPVILGIIGGIKLLGGVISGMSSWMGGAGALAGIGTLFSGITDSLGILSTRALGVGPGIAKIIGDILSGVGGGLGIGGGGIFSGIISGMETLYLTFLNFGGIGGIFKGAFGAIISGITGFAGSILSGITAMVSFVVMITGIVAAVLAIGAVIAGVAAYIYKNWDQFKVKFEAIWDAIKDAVSGFIENFKSALGIADMPAMKFADILGLIYEKVEPIARVIANVLVGAFQLLAEILKSILPAIGTFLGALIRGIVMVAAGILDFIGGVIEMIAGLWEAIKTGDWTRFLGGWEKLKLGVLEILGGLATVVLGLFTGLFQLIGGLIMSAAKSIAAWFGLEGLVEKVGGVVNAVVGWFEWLYNKLIGGSIIPDLVNGIKKWFEKPVKFIKSIFKKISKTLAPFINIIKRLLGVFRLFFNYIKTAFKKGGIAGGFDALKKALPMLLTILGRLGSAFLGELGKIGKMIIDWVWNTALPALGTFIIAGYNFIKENLPTWVIAIGTALGKIASALWTWATTTAIPAIASWISAAANYIKENAPGWWAALAGALTAIASGIAAWILETGIPALAGWITGVYNYLVENVPTWWAALSTALATIATSVATWIAETGIPMLAAWVTGVYNYLVENFPLWLTALMTALGTIWTAISGWIMNEAVPLLGTLISEGVTILSKIATEWLAKIQEGLDEIKKAFEETFKTISKVIEEKIKSGLNAAIALTERAINKIIGTVNNLIKNLNNISAKLGLPLIKELQKVKIPRLAKGGIAMSKQLAMVGEVPEAIIPLSKLDKILGEAVGGGETRIEININNPIVRDEEDLRHITDVIQRRLGLQLSGKVALAGRGMAY